MKSIGKILKKVLITMFCALMILCMSICAYGLIGEAEQAFATLVSETNSAVTYDNADSLGKFVDGYVYRFTDVEKYSKYRDGAEYSDVTKITVSSIATPGSKENPYVISTISDWEKFVKFCAKYNAGNGKYFVLANDIDFSGNSIYPVTVFNGTFYGSGFTLKNVKIDADHWAYWNESSQSFIKITATSTTSSGFALFCTTTNNATITDFVLDNYQYNDVPDIHGYPSSLYSSISASIVAVVASGNLNVLNCHATGEKKDSAKYSGLFLSGGLIGIVRSSTATIYRCSAKVDIIKSTTDNQSLVAGGILAQVVDNNAKCNILDCVASISISLDTTSAHFDVATAIGWVSNSASATVENFIGYLDCTICNGGKNYDGSLTGIDNSAGTLIFKNCFTCGCTGNEGNKLSMASIGTWKTNLSNIDLSTTYNVKETGTYYSVVDGSVTYDANTQPDYQTLLDVARNILIANKIWDVSKIGEYSADNNPIRSILRILIPTTVEAVYNGKIFDLTEMYPEITATCDTNCLDAGIHRVNVDITDLDYYGFYNLPFEQRTAIITIVISKIQIEISTNLKTVINDDGTLKDDALITARTPYISGDTKTPVFGLEYLINGVWTTALPVKAGDYRVRAYIKNPENCNYELSSTETGETDITIAPKNVAMPHLVLVGEGQSQIDGSAITVAYNGKTQEFKLVNNADNNALDEVIVIKSLNNGIVAKDQIKGLFAAKAVNEYTITVELRDKANYRWADYQNDASDTRTVTLHITKQDLVVEYDNDTLTKWEKGERSSVVATVKGVACDESGRYEDVKLLASYTANEGNPVYVDYNDIVSNGDSITVTFNLATFLTGERYKLRIALDPTSTTNNNYSLDNNPTTSFDFIITVSVIRGIDILWTYANILAQTSTGNVFGEGDSVPYNGQEYIVSLDETKLARGLIVTYKNEKGTNAGTYKSTVSFTCENGYEIQADIPKNYTINWNIALAEIDLYYLTWKEDFTYNGKFQTMEIDKLPEGVTAKAILSSKVKASEVGKYVASYELSCDQNHKFVLSQDVDGYTIDSGANDKKATVNHNWEIKKVVISVSSLDGEWNYIGHTDANGTHYYLPVPKAMSEYGNQLELKYYSDENFENELNVNEIEVDAENGVDYYAKVTLKDDVGGEYEINNVNNDDDYAYVRFTVGGGYSIVPVTISETNLIYNGKPQQITVASAYTFVATYYKGNSEAAGVFGAGEFPTDAGEYLVTIACSEDDKILADTNRFILTINKLQLTVNGWSENKDIKENPLALPEVSVIPSCADKSVTIDFIKSLFDYEVYDQTGATKIDGNLNYNTSYVVKMVITNDNVEFGSKNGIEYSFRTGYNPNQTADRIAKPRLVTNEIEWTGEDITFEIAYWENVYSDVLEIVGGELTAKDVDNYSIRLKIKEGANVVWVEDGTSDDVELTYSIVERTIDLPKFPQEIRYTGEEINIFDLLYPLENRWDLWLELVEGEEKQINAGSYTVKLKLNETNKNNLKWADYLMPQSEAGVAPLYAVDYEWINEELIITIYWDILPAQIKGEWQIENGVPTFKAESDEFDSIYKLVYLDADGNEIAKEDFVSGTAYTAELRICDNTIADNYEFVSDKPNFELTNEFFYVAPSEEPSLFDKALDYIKANWWWMIIILAVVILLIIIFVVAKKCKKKKEELKAQEAKKVNEQKTQEENSKIAELEKKLEQAMQNNNQQPQQYNNGFVNPQYNGNVNPNVQIPTGVYYQQPMPQYQNNGQPEQDALESNYNVNGNEIASDIDILNLDDELAKLRARVQQLEKYKLATDEEKIQNSQLANVETMWMQFLLSNFKKNLNRSPFNSQDMVDYPLDKLMEIYTQVKKLIENKLSDQPKEIRNVETQAGIETKVDKVNDMKNDSQYKRILEELRDIKAENKELANRLDAAEKKQIEKELESAKKELDRLKHERLIEVDVPVEVEKIVEKEVIKEVPVEKVVEKIVEKEIKVPVAAPAKPKKEVAPRLTLDEAYALLSKQQKKYFDSLREYALSKDKSKEKKSTYSITIGQSTVNPLLKLTIKKDMTVALFKMEDEYLKDIKRDASGDGTKIKVKETEVIISDAQACKAAKNMIDLREDQIERYNDLLKEQRAMNRKK